MLTSIGDVMREAYKRGWLSTRDGNISLYRKDSKLLYITPSGVRKTILHPESIVKRKWVGEAGDYEFTVPMKGDDNPSGELLMHELLQRCAIKTQAVVHLHPTHCVAAMLAGFRLETLVKHFPELGRYTRVAPNVGVCPPVSEQLAWETYACMTNQTFQVALPNGIRNIPIPQLNEFVGLHFDVVGQAGHGVTAVGANPWECFEHIERLNHIAEIVLASHIKPEDLG